MFAWIAALATDAQDLSDVLPDLKTAPVPPSIVEGRRLNYLAEIATVPAAYFYEWVDSAGSTNQYDMPSPSGRGYNQVDVIGVGPRFVALHVQPWLFHDYTGPLNPLFGSDQALVSHAGGGDWYAHPAVLATVSPTIQQGLKILRMPLKVGARIFNALRIQSEAASSQVVTCYDLDTGYLIYKASAVSGKQGVTVTQLSFMGARDMAMPWATGLLPAWVAIHPRLRYEGTYTAVATGGMPLSLPLAADIDITAHAPNWFVYEQTTTLDSLQGMPPTVERKTLASGIPSPSPLCLPTPFPTGLTPGRRLDTDDVTGAVLEVAAAGPLGSGRTGVVLRLSVGELAWSETAYDADTGVALALRTFSGPSPFYYTASELHLVGLPPEAPQPPQLSVTRVAGGDTLRVSWIAEANHRSTLQRSEDGGLSWTAVPGYTDLEGDNRPRTHEILHPAGAAMYRVSVR